LQILTAQRDQDSVLCKISTQFLGVNIYITLLVHGHILLCPFYFSYTRAQKKWCLITGEPLAFFHFAEYGPRSWLLHNIQDLLKDRNINFFIGYSVTVVTVISEYSHKTSESLLCSLFGWRTKAWMH